MLEGAAQGRTRLHTRAFVQFMTALRVLTVQRRQGEQRAMEDEQREKEATKRQIDDLLGHQRSKAQLAEMASKLDAINAAIGQVCGSAHQLDAPQVSRCTAGTCAWQAAACGAAQLCMRVQRLPATRS